MNSYSNIVKNKDIRILEYIEVYQFRISMKLSTKFILFQQSIFI